MAWSNHFADVPVTLSMGGSASLKITARVKFRYHPGSPAKGPNYSHGGLPPDPWEIDDIQVDHICIDYGNRKRTSFPCPSAISEWIVDNVDYDMLADRAAEDIRDKIEEYYYRED
jgi:hypothetical protein